MTCTPIDPKENAHKAQRIGPFATTTWSGNSDHSKAKQMPKLTRGNETNTITPKRREGLPLSLPRFARLSTDMSVK